MTCINDTVVLIDCVGLELLEVFIHLSDGIGRFCVGVSRAGHDVAVLTDVRRRWSRASRRGRSRGVRKFQECVARHNYMYVSGGDVDLIEFLLVIHFSMLPEVHQSLTHAKANARRVFHASLQDRFRSLQIGQDQPARSRSARSLSSPSSSSSWNNHLDTPLHPSDADYAGSLCRPRVSRSKRLSPIAATFLNQDRHWDRRKRNASLP